MIKKQHWFVALFIAFTLHAAAFITFASTEQIKPAKDAGVSGIEIDLGMLGDLDVATADPVVQEPVIEQEPEVEPVVEPEPPEVVEPEPIPEPVKLDPKPVVQKDDVHIKKQVKKPEVKKEKKIVEVKPKPNKPVQQKSATTAKSSTKTSTSTSHAKKMTTGSKNAVSSGAQKNAERSYFSELSAKLARHKRYPSRARRAHQEGVVVLFIMVNRDGTVKESYISKSSGHPKLDEAVLEMLRRASPLPAFLDDMKQTQLSINIPIDFKLSDRR